MSYNVHSFYVERHNEFSWADQAHDFTSSWDRGCGKYQEGLGYFSEGHDMAIVRLSVPFVARNNIWRKSIISRSDS